MFPLLNSIEIQKKFYKKHFYADNRTEVEVTEKKENFNRTWNDPPTNHPKIRRSYLNLSTQLKRKASKKFLLLKIFLVVVDLKLK